MKMLRPILLRARVDEEITDRQLNVTFHLNCINLGHLVSVEIVRSICTTCCNIIRMARSNKTAEMSMLLHKAQVYLTVKTAVLG